MKKLLLLVLLQTTQLFTHTAQNITHTLGITCNNQVPFVQELNNLGILSQSNNRIICVGAENLPLFNQFPTLSKKISYISLADLPTPLTAQPKLSAYLRTTALYIKHDDLTGTKTASQKLYGGNKVRKLEFLLADAQAHGAQSVITFGCAGSNHALATAVYAHQLGMKCTNFLKPQINSPVVKQNLLLAQKAQADLFYFPDNNTRKVGACAEWLQSYQRSGNYPYVIPTGGSCPVGVLGFVNAALELKQQIMGNQLPIPDYLYVATGSCGTVAGLTLGLQLAGLAIPIMAIATEPHDDHAEYQQELEDLYAQTNQFLHEKDSTIPQLPFPKDLVTIRYEFAGGDYGMPTPDGLDAQELFKKYADINLDPTYTAKAAAALVADASANKLADKTVIYWDTYCGLDFTEITQTVKYKELPVCFHEYFE